MDYSSYSVEQFVADEQFQEWVLRPTDELNRFWNTFLSEHPGRMTDVAEARRLIVLWQQTQSEPIETAELETIWRTIQDRIDSSAQVRPFRRVWWHGWPYAAAAVLLLVSGLIGWQFLRPDSSVVLSTNYGETRRVTLPDHSVVTLNAHSSIRYAADLAQQPTREVWLTGEAFFSVHHTRTHQPFRVHAAQVAVDVLGTEFNVSDRRNAVRVVLTSGKVRINRTNMPAVGTILKPGELAELQTGTPNLLKRRVQPAAYTSWQQHRWELRQETLTSVALRIEETFGVAVQIEDNQDRALTVTGHLPTQQLDVLCAILSETLHRRFELTGQTLLIHSSNQSNP